MRKDSKFLGSVILSGLLLASFTGCDSSSDSPVADNTLSAFYIDAAVEGVDYTTSSGLSGLTDSNGQFSFNSGDSVTFKIGDLILRTQTSIEDGAKIYETDDRVITLLQSIDLDGNASNGITLNSDIKAEVATWLNGATTVDINSSDNKIANITALETALVAAGITTTRSVDVITARAHVAEVAVNAALENIENGDEIPFGDGAFSPYERVAVFPTVKDRNGHLDYNATYAKVAELANTFAKHVANVDEPASDSTTFKGANWILAGTELPTVNALTDAEVTEHILGIPTKLPINPVYAISPANTKKVKVVEVCNSTYAGQALGVTNVGGDTGAKVAEGIYHTTALPCEITIYNDENGIYVDMLNPETIFTLFFTEVFSSVEMQNQDFATAMMALPTQVKDEIYAMIYNAFDTAGESYIKTSIKKGTIYSSMSQVTATTDTANGGMEPYRHYSYTSDGSKEFTSTDAKIIAANIISVMTSDAEGVVGVQEAPLLALLPSTQIGVVPSWRSGRLEPLKVPGGSWIVEACSPTYAKEALTTGEFHTPALPCEIAVFVNPDNNTTIDISFLNPEFMFGAMFADGLATMTVDEITAFNLIIENINGDLKAIVDYAIENNVTDGSFTGSNTKITPINY